MDWPSEAHGVAIPLDGQGQPRLFTTVDSSVQGIALRRRMTSDEVQNWVESKTGTTKVRPLEIEGTVP